MNTPQCGRRAWCALATLALMASSVLLPTGFVWGQGNAGSQSSLRTSIEDMVNFLGQAVRDGNRREVRQVDRDLEKLIHVMEHQWSHHHHHHHHGHFHNGMQQAAKQHQQSASQAPATNKSSGGTGGSAKTTTNQGAAAAKTSNPATAATTPLGSKTTASAAKAAVTATLGAASAHRDSSSPEKAATAGKSLQQAKTSAVHQPVGILGQSKSGVNAGASHGLASALANARKSDKQLTPKTLAKAGHSAGAAVGLHKSVPHSTVGKKK